MMRGPSYDDAYISRKMSHLHGPTFSAPGPVSYGRPPIGGYLQEPYSYDYVPRRSQTNTTGVAKARSLSQEVPYLWPEVDNNLKERRSRKGWYRVDFGPQQSTELRYLPTSRDKLNFLRSYAEPVSYSAFDLPRATSVPPPARKSRKSGSSTYWTTTRYRPITTVIPYTRPRSSSYSYWYYPSLRPYWSSLWTSPRYLNPIAGRARSLSPPIRVSTSWSGYAPLGPPPPRMVPRMPPAYYDYDYGYGGYYGYAPPPPRISRYDSYLDDDLPEPAYVPRYRPRLPDPLDDADFRDRSHPHLITTTTTTTTPRTTAHTRGYSPGAPAAPSATRAVTTADGDDSLALVPARGRTGSRLRPHLQSVPRQEVVPGETEGERHLARLAHRYPSLSEPQMLQDHVDKMRIRLKSLAYSLDPTGPVPEIILPDRHKKSGALDDKKYSSGPKHLACVEFAGGQPQWKRKARARFPPDDPENVAKLCKEEIKDAEEAPEKEKEKLILKDRLSNRIHEFFNSTMTADQFDKYLKTYRQPGPKLPHAQVRGGYARARLYDSSALVMPDSSSRYTKLTSKWEEPDTVFGAPTDKKPYSKVETGSSFFSTYGYTNRKKDYVGEKVRDYYYFGDSAKDTGRVHFDGSAVKAITDGATEEGSEERKERRKKKKSKERELAPETSAVEAPADVSEVEPVSAPTESEPAAAAANGEPGADDDKERKKLEKKKRKAEREAAAKAAMEAELAALAAAEAELARLEAESSSLKPDAPAPEVSAPVEVAPAEPAAEVKSESAAEK
ncbi:uncharacterized protein [Procambarus clarkii]